VTKAEIYALVDQYVKVNPLTISADKTRGTDMRALLKDILDFAEQGNSAVVPFNGERPITAPIPGLQGTTLHGATEKEVLHNLLASLYPAQPPQASMNVTNPTRERGDMSAITYNWSATPQTNPITTIRVNGTAVVATGKAQSGNGTVPAGGQTSFSITVQDGTLSASASASVGYYPARFHGNSTLDHAGMLAALSNGQPIDYASLGFLKDLATNYLINADYNCSGGRYIHILYDASYGTPYLVRSGVNTFSAYTLSDVTMTDAFGVARAYKLLSTGIQFGSAVNIAIIT
jgi:hypothetical protein